jgi:hypothetical protein
MLNVAMLLVIKQGVIGFVRLNVVRLTVVMLNVVGLNVIW